MTSQELADHAKKLANEIEQTKYQFHRYKGVHAKACEFLARYSGPKSSFSETAQKEGTRYGSEDGAPLTASILTSFADYILSGLAEEITPERRAQLDVVSDLLDQANTLLESPKVHPAAPTVLIGAVLEEFLRTWAENEKVSLPGRPSIDTYAKALRDAELITKQDIKDITAWGGIRNHAAHGEWEHVQSREKISLMLQGVNLFLRRYEKGK